MILSADELTALENGEPVSVKIDDHECVVVAKSAFDQLTLSYDDSSLLPRDSYAAVLKAIDKDDENPDQYFEYLHNRTSLG